MRALSKTAHQTVEKLLSLLKGEDHCRLGEPGNAFMPLSIERIGEGQVSFSQWYVQNGDVMRDPEVTLWKGPDGNWYPVMYQQDNLGIYQELVRFNDQGVPTHSMVRQQADCAQFMTTWMRNLGHQFATELKAAA